MQKTKLLAITLLAALLLSTMLTVVTAQQAPSSAEQSMDIEENTLTGMAIGIGSALFTVGLIGVLYFRKQE
ncbi:hypothetical protein GX563_01415 [Candidatus Bathyarchaeota archaeon]|nr:hypothetical protein [Candidatus Bathyarchaeota archaeon]